MKIIGKYFGTSMENSPIAMSGYRMWLAGKSTTKMKVSRWGTWGSPYWRCSIGTFDYRRVYGLIGGGENIIW